MRAVAILFASSLVQAPVEGVGERNECTAKVKVFSKAVQWRERGSAHPEFCTKARTLVDECRGILPKYEDDPTNRETTEDAIAIWSGRHDDACFPGCKVPAAGECDGDLDARKDLCEQAAANALTDDGRKRFLSDAEAIAGHAAECEAARAEAAEKEAEEARAKAAAAAAKAEAEAKKKEKRRVVVGAVLVGVGGAGIVSALGGGIGWYRASDKTFREEPRHRYDKGVVNALEGHALALGVVLGGIGAALVAMGAVLIAKGKKLGKRERPPGQPSAGIVPGGASVGWTVRF